jgi:hypothetical protein
MAAAAAGVVSCDALGTFASATRFGYQTSIIIYSTLLLLEYSIIIPWPWTTSSEPIQKICTYTTGIHYHSTYKRQATDIELFPIGKYIGLKNHHLLSLVTLLNSPSSSLTLASKALTRPRNISLLFSSAAAFLSRRIKSLFSASSKG